MGPPARRTKLRTPVASYDAVLADVAGVIEQARRTAARSVNAVMTATYWLVGRRIVEEECCRAQWMMGWRSGSAMPIAA